MKNYYFTSESVTEGHPDKLCDYISDSILDECLKQDKNSRVAIETFVSANTVTIAGQITSTARLKIGELVREKIKVFVHLLQAEPAPVSRCQLGTSPQLDARAQLESPPVSLVRANRNFLILG